MKRALVVLLFVLFARPAAAIIPESGWWWNPSTSGTGFNLEVQDKLMFVAAFAYESNGNPTWLVAGGAMTSDRAFSATITKYSAGSCLGCPYNAPVSTNAGTMSLQFTSSQTAILTVNGYSMPVQRFDFWGSNDTHPDSMMGEWSMVIGETAFPVFFGERVQFSQKLSSSTGPYLGGNRAGAPNNLATVSYSTTRRVFYSLLDSSSSYWRYSEWAQTGFNRIEGNTWVFLKSESAPSGSGIFFQAHRTASASWVRTGIGPASSKARQVSDQELEAKDRGEAEAMAKRGVVEAIDPEVMGRFLDLRARIDQLRMIPE